MLHTTSSHNLDMLLKLLFRVAEIPNSKEYQTVVMWNEIQLIDKLHSGIFTQAGSLRADLLASNESRSGRVKGYQLLLSTEEVTIIASCLAIWEWFFPSEVAAARNEFASIRFLVRDILGNKV